MSDHAGAGIEAVRGRVEEVLGTGGFADTDDLFEHGLDSLGLIRLLGAWRESGHDVTFEELAADPTPAAWSAGAPSSSRERISSVSRVISSGTRRSSSRSRTGHASAAARSAIDAWVRARSPKPWPACSSA